MDTSARTTLPLLERSEELARIESVLDRVGTGRGSFAVVEGPGGIGKTTLLTAVRAAATGHGIRVLRSRGAELERDFVFGVVRQLFEPVLLEATESERADVLQGAAGIASGLLGLPGGVPRGGEAPGNVDPSFAVLHGLYWLSANLAAQGPLCLIVDDAQWADAPSLRYLAFLLTRLEEHSIALLVATRPREAGTDPDLLAAVTSDPSAELIRLAPLTRAGVEILVESGLGVSPDPTFVDACVRATSGMPFLMRELVEALAESDVAPTSEFARHVEKIGARTVGRSIRLRLRRLPEPARRLAVALAVLERGELSQTARLAGLEEGEAADAADLLATAGILESDRPLTFVHPIVRTGIYSELAAGERAQGHGRAARILAEQPGSKERVAEHLLESERAADGWVVAWLADAARAASSSGAPESAAVYLRRALAEPPAPSESPSLLLELGMAEASAGQPEWYGHLQGAVDAAPDESSASASAMVLALALSRTQRFADAVSVLDRAATRIDPTHTELATLLEVAAVGAGMLDGATAPGVARRRALARRDAAADSDAPPELLALAAFSAVLANEPASAGVELAERALQAGVGRADRPWFSFATWFSQVTVSLVWTEKYDRALPLLDDSIAQARAIGDSARLAVGLAHRAWVALRRGDLGAAEGDTRTALAAAELPAPALYRVLNGGILIQSLVERGDLEAAQDVLGPIDDDADVPSLTAAVLRFARGQLRVAQGRLGEGLADFLGVGELCATAAVDCPSYLPWRSAGALAQLQLGDRDAARALAMHELELAATFGAPRALGVAQRAAGIVTAGEAGDALLRDAIESLELADARLERAKALADLGARLRLRNRRTEARKLLREALDTSSRSHAAPLAKRAETELRATGAKPRRVALSGVESLTASERRVAELASQNLTNREIAQTLFVTARTVEGHLTGVFRKLRVESREQLPSALSGDAPSQI